MSGTDALPDEADDLLDLDRDREDFDDEEAYRDYVDSQLAEIQDRLDATETRDDVLESRADALHSGLEDVREEVEEAKERAERAELVASWGGLGYDDRLSRVVDALVRRAATGSPTTLSGPSGKHTTRKSTIATTEQDGRPGVHELFDGAVSERTCRNYVEDLAECEGLSVSTADRGGWGGGSSSKQLQMDLSTFRAAYGEDWEIDDLMPDIRGGDDDD